MQIKPKHVHLWRAFLPDLMPQLSDFSRLLNPDEQQRAARFHFEHHRNRFILARGILRRLLSLYLSIPAEQIAFKSGARGKPFLQANPIDLQFNVSHSHDAAVYAFTMGAEIGVDIEKIQPTFDERVAERFFSAAEYAALLQLSPEERIPAFYQIWAGKEAIIKALGEGLYVPLGDFSIDLKQSKQIISLIHQQQDYQYQLEYFNAYADYQSAYATAQSVTHTAIYRWNAIGPAS